MRRHFESRTAQAVVVKSRPFLETELPLFVGPSSRIQKARLTRGVSITRCPPPCARHTLRCLSEQATHKRGPRRSETLLTALLLGKQNQMLDQISSTADPTVRRSDDFAYISIYFGSLIIF